MKKAIISIVSGLLISQGSLAAEWSFKFSHKGETFETALTASTYDLAFEKAAKSCFQFFLNNQKITDELGDKLISICANPKST